MGSTEKKECLTCGSKSVNRWRYLPSCKKCLINERKLLDRLKTESPEEYKILSEKINKEKVESTRAIDRVRGAKKYSDDPVKVRSTNMQSRYGISANMIPDLLQKQNGLCAICKNPEKSMFRGKVKSLALDHDHRSKKIRGLLCQRCNLAIGAFNDDQIILASAASYILKHAGELPWKEMFDRIHSHY